MGRSLRGRHKKGRERGQEKSTKEGKGKGAPSLPFSPLPPSLFPYPLPVSTPAMQARWDVWGENSGNELEVILTTTFVREAVKRVD